MKALTLLPLFIAAWCMGQMQNTQLPLPHPYAERAETKQAANPENHNRVPYNLLKPDKVYDLPEILREISGLVWLADNEVYAIQDEIGAVFHYQLHPGKIINLLRFGSDADYEDLAMADDQLYVLRSDGTIFSFNHRNHNGQVEQTIALTPCTNLEGLFYHRQTDALLLACKSAAVNGSPNERPVYRMNRNETQQTVGFLSIDQKAIQEMLAEHDTDLNSRNKPVEFNPSAVAMHPVNGQLYVLSASDRLLAVYQHKSLIAVIPLPPEIYYKPEGLAFSDQGDLYISSEGMKNRKRPAQILHFRMLGD